MRANIQLLQRALSKCKHTAGFCVVGCKEGRQLNYSLASPYLGIRRNIFKNLLKI